MENVSMSIAEFKELAGMSADQKLQFANDKENTGKYWCRVKVFGEEVIVGTTTKGTLRSDIASKSVETDRLRIYATPEGAFVLCYGREAALSI